MYYTTKRILLIVLSIVVIIALGFGGVVLYAQWQYSKVQKVTLLHLAPIRQTTYALPTPTNTEPFNVLVIGSDTRSFVQTNQQAQSFGSASDVTGARSDVIKIVRFVPTTQQIYTLSIPRDLWVTIPQNSSGISGSQKINAALNGGPDLLIQTIEQNLNIPINHYASINFQGFSQAVDAIGGVKMNFSTPLKDDYSGLNVQTTGCQLLNGQTALALVRARHLQYLANNTWQYDGLSDISRIERQDVFFKALAAQTRSLGLSPLKISDLVSSIAQNLTIDSTWSLTDLLALANQYKSANVTSITTQMLPTVGYNAPDGESALTAAQPYATDTIAAFLAAGTAAAPTTTSTKSTTSPTAPQQSSASTTTTLPATTTTAPAQTSLPGNVYAENVQEPWNPTPC